MRDSLRKVPKPVEKHPERASLTTGKGLLHHEGVAR